MRVNGTKSVKHVLTVIRGQRNGGSRRGVAMDDRILDVQDLRVVFQTDFGKRTVTDDISFHVDRNEMLGVVGESGCGKSVTSMAVMGLLPKNGNAEKGRIIFEGRDLLKLKPRELDQIRGKDLTMVFQDALAGLNPVFTVGNQLTEQIRAHEHISRAEAEKRGLLNLKTTADAMPYICDKKNVDMLTSHGIFTEAEIFSRCDIMLENYIKTVNIEAVTMVDMARKEIIPAVAKFAADTASAVAVKKSVSKVACKYETSLVSQLSELIDEMDASTTKLEAAISKLKGISDTMSASEFVRDTMLSAMNKLRSTADKAEVITSETYWPFPAYDKLLFGV